MALEERQPSGEVTPIHQVWYYQVLPKEMYFWKLVESMWEEAEKYFQNLD